jgi:hypothetical protein
MNYFNFVLSIGQMAKTTIAGLHELNNSRVHDFCTRSHLEVQIMVRSCIFL